MATQQDIDAGAQALKNYVESIDGWEADFVPWGTYEQGSELVLNEWDGDGGAPANPDAVATKQASCGLTLYQTISNAGYGDRVTADQCAAAAVAVLAATKRGQINA